MNGYLGQKINFRNVLNVRVTIGIKKLKNKMSRGLYKTDIERIMGKVLKKEGMKICKGIQR